MEISGFLGDAVVLCDFFSWKLSYVFQSKQVRGYFDENRHVVFFWKLPRKRACDVLIQQTPERTKDACIKGIIITQQTVEDSLASVHLVTICWSSFGFSDTGFC